METNELKEEHKKIMSEIPDRGKEDGYSNIPSKDSQQLSPYEKQIRSKYQGLINIMGGDREKELVKCSKERIDNFRVQRDKITQAVIDKEISVLDEQEASDLETAERIQIESIKEISSNAKLKAAKLDKDASEKEFKKLCKDLNRSSTDKADIPSDKWYKAILIFIGISELAINFQIFQIFRENLPLTFIMSLCLLSTAMGAHITGSQLKQWSGSKNKVVEGGLISVINIAIVLLFGWVAYLRSVELDSTHSGAALWIFGLLSIVLYFVGIYMAFNHVDSSKAFYKAYSRHKVTAEEYDDISKDQNSKKADAEKEYSDKVESIKSKWEAKRKIVTSGVEGKDLEIANLATEHNEIISKYKKMDQQCNSYFESAVQSYRSYNLSQRVTDAPVSWDAEVEPLKLNELKYEKI